MLGHFRFVLAQMKSLNLLTFDFFFIELKNKMNEYDFAQHDTSSSFLIFYENNWR